LVRGLIYPVPDPRYPFLGVHLTRRIDGEVLVGPNAVLAHSREGYGRAVPRPADLWATLTYPGFWRLARRHWRTGIHEAVGSVSRRAFVGRAQQYVPELTTKDVVDGPVGIRAQAVERSGLLVDDFRIDLNGRVLCLRNAPSPAATSSLAIAEYVCDRLLG
jgi:L-2-hydroxyglutarate oxidase LhgO